jgi:uncharacterized membrane protein
MNKNRLEAFSDVSAIIITIMVPVKNATRHELESA